MGEVTKRIVLDVDGVLADFNNAFRDLIISRGGRMDPIPQEGPPVWDYYNLLGATREQVTEAWQFIRENPAWWGTLKPYQEALDARPLLHDLFTSHWVIVLTSRIPSHKGEMVTKLWLQAHFGLPKTTPVIHVEDKGLLIHTLGGVERIIDDHPHLGRQLKQLAGLRNGAVAVPRIYQPSWAYNDKTLAYMRGPLDAMIKEVMK